MKKKKSEMKKMDKWIIKRDQYSAKKLEFDAQKMTSEGRLKSLVSQELHLQKRIDQLDQQLNILALNIKEQEEYSQKVDTKKKELREEITAKLKKDGSFI